MENQCYVSHYCSPIGEMTMASDGKALIGLWFDGQKYALSTVKQICSEPILDDSLPEFVSTREWLDKYFNQEIPDFWPPIHFVGTPFRKIVWELLQKIPFGGAVTYGELGQAVAKEMGVKSMSAQAIGGAVGHNPISIIVPCHRVIGADGSLTGYAGGIERKSFLLKHEGVRFLA